MAGEVNEVSAQAPIENNVQETQVAPQEEKLLSQSAVNEIVGSVRSKAYQKGYAEAEQAYQAKIAQNSTAPQVAQQPTGSLSAEDVKRITAEQMKALQEQQQKQYAEAQQQAEIQKAFSELAPKVAAGAKKYDDFDEVVSAVDFLNEAPDVLLQTNAVDNSADVLYELARSPAKIGALRNLSPKLAALEIQKISRALKRNEDATNQGRGVPAPLSQIKSTNIGTSNGESSISELRKKWV